MLRFLTAGESHGKGLVGIIEGMPANLNIDRSFINTELSRRQKGYGRGSRMKIENDTITILSGVRNGKTIGSPISLYVENRDWNNWKEIMNDEKSNISLEDIVTRPRPGHGDLSGAIKYNQEDIRNIIERASARETAMRVAIGSIAKLFINEFNINIYSHVVKIGSVKIDEGLKSLDSIKLSDLSPIRVIDKEAETMMIKEIDSAKASGDTLGGVFEVIATNVPIGLGSHVNWDRKLDGRIAQGIMSLNGIKGVEIGKGFEFASMLGSLAHDEIFYDNSYYRKTNNAGGIEAGTSNGDLVVVRAAMKPIPSLGRPLKSIDMKTKESFEAQKERADVCAVPSASIISESILAWIIAEEFLVKFGGDYMEEIKGRYKLYQDYVNRR